MTNRGNLPQKGKEGLGICHLYKPDQKVTKKKSTHFFIINCRKTRKVDKKKKRFITILGDWNIGEYDPNGAFIPNGQWKRALHSTPISITDFKFKFKI